MLKPDGWAPTPEVQIQEWGAIGMASEKEFVLLNMCLDNPNTAYLGTTL